MNDIAPVVPLWERLPSAFGYAFRRSPLILGLLLGLAGAVLIVHLSEWVAVLLYAIMFKYAFVAVFCLAAGIRGEQDWRCSDPGSVLFGHRHAAGGDHVVGAVAQFLVGHQSNVVVCHGGSHWLAVSGVVGVLVAAGRRAGGTAGDVGGAE